MGFVRLCGTCTCRERPGRSKTRDAAGTGKLVRGAQALAACGSQGTHPFICSFVRTYSVLPWSIYWPRCWGERR